MNQLPPFKAGEARAEKGYFSPIPELAIPYGIIEGAEPGPCLLVTAGVHGAEFCSIEAALRLLQTDPGEIRGTIVVLPILNVEGFKARSIGVMPEDGKNLNRSFPGRADGTVSERLAAWLVENVYPNVDAYLDLHGGDLTEEILPIAIFPEGSKPSESLARAFGLPMIVSAGSPSSTTISAAANLAVPSSIVEIGGNGLWDDEKADQFTQGIRRVMVSLGIIADTAAAAASPKVEMVNLQTMAAEQDGIWYPAKKLSETVVPGELIGEIKDAFGSTLADIKSEIAGVVLYRLTSLSVSSGETLFGIGAYAE